MIGSLRPTASESGIDIGEPLQEMISSFRQRTLATMVSAMARGDLEQVESALKSLRAVLPQRPTVH